MPSATIPVTVIGGYLGAGKTTLLNRLLHAAPGVHRERLAVLVNDFGSVAVDASLVESADGTTIRLSNGCVCCSLAGGFVEAMERVAAIEPRPDRLVVETSGVADPAAVAEYAHLPGFTLDAVVVLADAETIRARAADALVGRQVRAQLAGADLVVLNKIDLLDASGTAGGDRLEALRDWTARQAPDAHVVTAVDASIDLDLLWGRAPARRTATTRDRERADHDDDQHDHDDDQHDHDHHHESAHPVYVAFTVEGASTVAREVLQDALDEVTVEASIVRLKGFVDLDDGGRHLVQVVGRRRRITPFASTPHDTAGLPVGAVSLVVIGLADSPSVTDMTDVIDRLEAVRRAAHVLARRLGAAVVDEHH